jgi:hypothetical protein
MSDDNVISLIQHREDTVRHLAALHEIAMDSADADVVRIALEALTGTASGRAYLILHPVVL